MRLSCSLLPALASTACILLACDKGTSDTGASRRGAPAPQPTATVDAAGEERIGPEPELVLAMPPSGPKGIHIDGDLIYFGELEHHTIRRVLKDGSGLEEVTPAAAYILTKSALFTRRYDEATSTTWVRIIDKTDLTYREVELSGYYYRHAAEEGVYYASGIGCANPTRVDLATGEVAKQLFPPITEGGGSQLLVTDEYVYCSNSWSLIRLPKDFSAPPEYVFQDKAYFRSFNWDNGRIVWLQHYADFGTYDGTYPPHSIWTMEESTLQPRRLVTVPRSANVGAFVFDESTRCYYYTDTGIKYGDVQYYCEGKTAEVLVNLRDIKGGLDIDATHVYWAERDGIKRLPKPVIAD